MLNHNRVKVHHTPQMIQCNIENIENQMRLAIDWKNSSIRAGLCEQDQFETYESMLPRLEVFYPLF